MFLEVTFSNGSIGRYPCTAGATVTIQEPDVTNEVSVVGTGPTYRFALADATAVSLVQGDLSPPDVGAAAQAAAEADVAAVDAAAAAPADAVPAADAETETPAEDAAEGAEETTPGPIAAAASSDTPSPAIVEAASQVAAVHAAETPEQQLTHATDVAADIQAALEKWPGDPDLTDALTHVQSLITDLTPPPSGA